MDLAILHLPLPGAACLAFQNGTWDRRQESQLLRFGKLWSWRPEFYMRAWKIKAQTEKKILGPEQGKLVVQWVLDVPEDLVRGLHELRLVLMWA